jgi:uncharacterized sulfatase
VRPGASDQVAISIDLAPTVLHSVGGTPAPDMPGLDLLDVRKRASRTEIFGEVFEHNAIDIHRPAANLQYRWVIAGDWKLIVPHEPNAKGAKSELYHITRDPHEADDLTAKHPDKVAELTRKLDGWWKPE